jgi:murein hydrolase activator
MAQYPGRGIIARLPAPMGNVRRWVLLAAGVASLGTTLPALPQADQARELEAVRARIVAIERRLASEHAERGASGEALRRAELDAATAARELERLRDETRAQQSRAAQLTADTHLAQARLAGEGDAVANQIRASYMSGRAEVFRLLLSQEDPADVGRMVVYYDYLLRTRGERIEGARSELRTLAELSAETRRVSERLAALEAAQAAEVASLNAARAQRQQVLANLDASIAAGDAEMARLRAEEQRLVDLIDELRELLAGLPVNADEPFSGVRGQLVWPVAGQVAGDFGRPRNGGPMRWNGVLLEAAQSAPVRAIYHGRVVFSDWLPGLGLLIILDHGDGYMSLYGHNEALLRESGDWVAPGEVIAQAGDTGGLSRPSLYFEIRQNGAPVNPHPWFAARPAGR